ncbi:hypothetical protein B566_EDAN005361 [Ephemera danica]|nr:hypothetical protein B566_EDAN005361 [Ephemera danica]
MRCQVPSYVAEYVMVTSWIQDGTINIYPNTDTGGKYAVLSSGDLYIYNAGPSDGYKSYACRTVHRLTGEVQASAYPGRIIINEPKGNVQPRITVEKHSTRQVKVGDDVTLPCVAQGFPVPSYSMLAAGLLRISKVRLEDRGKYLCWVNNSAGEETVQVTLTVTASLSAHVQPQSQVVDVGKSAVFQCIPGGHPVTHVAFEMSRRETLTIRPVQKDDHGMYQCFVSNEWDMAQATTELQLGDASPELLYWFSEQTLQPGPAVSLKCVATGNPPPQFVWTLDGFPVPDNNRFLVGQYVTIHDDVISHVNISSLREEDGGEYTCTARNSVAQVGHSARINVYDGSILPVNRRQRVYPNGTLVIEHAQRYADAGTYTCQAQNRQKHSARRDVEVQVIVPPKILPIQAMTNLLREGMRAAISCQILEGDLPVTFRWERNGQPLPSPGLAAVARRLDEYSTSLVIERISSAHSVPPRWTIEPTDTNMASGQDVVLNCQADGYPVPNVTWRKADGNNPGEYKDFLFEPNVKFYKNGSLEFFHISKDSEGHYVCEAKNGIGTGVSKVVYLKVNAPAYFPQKTKQIQVQKGEQAHLQCTALGDVPMEITWRIGGQRIADLDKRVYHDSIQRGIGGSIGGRLDEEDEALRGFVWRRYSTREQMLDDGMVSELGISHTYRHDTGVLSCFARNAYGEDEMTIQLIVQEVPEPPKNIRVSDQQSRSLQLSWTQPDQQSRSLQLSWTQPYAGNSPITNYIIQFKLVSEVWQAQPAKLVVPGTHTSATMTNLNPATSYHFRIIAENRLGLGEPGEIIQVTTQEEAQSSTELQISWEPPPREQWNGNILGYYVGFRERSLGSEPSSAPLFSPSLAPNTGSYSFKTVEASSGSRVVLASLAKYTMYNIVVQAFNTPSMPPENVRCVSPTSQSLQVSWEPPPTEGRNGVIQGYKVTHQAIDDWLDGEGAETKVTSQLRTTLPGLKRYTNYSVSVLAFTSSGDGARSDPLLCKTEEDVPSAPADIKAVVSAQNKILVTWLPPAEPNGVLVAYTLYTGLLEDGKEELVTAWKQDLSLPCKRVGVPVPQSAWRLRGRTLETGGRKQINKDGSLVIKDIQNSDEGNYTCKVENAHGSDEISYNVRVRVPPEPPVLSVVNTQVDSLHLQWTSKKNGGSPILGYVINYKRDYGDWEELQIESNVESHILRGLWCGTHYQLYVTAYNRIGTGLPSDIVSAHTKGTVPVKPTQSQLLTVNATVVTFWLDTWGDGGCSILYFVVEYREWRNSDWSLSSSNVQPAERVYSISDLKSATRYAVRITAHNNAGSMLALYNFTTLTAEGVTVNPAFTTLAPPSNVPFYANPAIMISIAVALCILLLLLLGLAWIFVLRKKLQPNNASSMAESPSIAQMQNQQNRDQQYLAVRVAHQAVDTASYKTGDSAGDYIEDICPYATFQLSKTPYSESTYSGNVYSGPYHSVQGSFVYHDLKPSGADTYKMRHKEPEYTKVRRKGNRLRDPHSESQESDNLGSTDSEVKKILTLHLPISEYDTLGSDSEIEPAGAQGGSGSAKGKGQGMGKRQVRSSSGYSSHTEETTFSGLASKRCSFSERIHPPSRFSDSHSHHELSEAECDRDKMGRKQPPRLSRSRDTSFQINV